jgi:hypothetical protein
VLSGQLPWSDRLISSQSDTIGVEIARIPGLNPVKLKQLQKSVPDCGAARGAHLPAQAHITGFQLTAAAAAALLDVSTADWTG